MSPAETERLPDWQERLDAVVRAWLDRPYDLISANCCHFAGDVIAALTGADWWAELGVSNTETVEDVARARLQFGGTEGIAAAYLGERQPRLLLRVGDIALAPGEHDDTLGVVMGASALFVTAQGLARVSLADCKGGWRLGA